MRNRFTDSAPSGMARPLSDLHPRTSARPPLPQSTMHMVFNEGSGTAEAALKEEMETVLKEAGRPVAWHDASGGRTLQSAREAAAAARDGGGVIVAVGGDGTVSAVAQQALINDVPMAVVPAGTFNLFARAQGIPLDQVEALKAAMSQTVRRVSVGLAGNRVFVVSVSLGVHRELIVARNEDTRRFGRGSRVAWLSGVARLWQMRSSLSLYMEGENVRENVRASTLVVSNNPVQLATVGAAVDVDPGDNLSELQVFVVPPLRGWQWVPVVLRALIGRLREAEGVRYHSLRRLSLQPRKGRPLKLAVDGELVDVHGPLVLQMANQALSLVVADPEEVA